MTCVFLTYHFENHVNPRVHYDTTGIEILDALGDAHVGCRRGPGPAPGHSMPGGAGYRIKERLPSCVVIAADCRAGRVHDAQRTREKTSVFGNNCIP